jgi:hypothetical protein
MFSSICFIRTAISLALRTLLLWLTAQNLLPSTATSSPPNKLSFLHNKVNSWHTFFSPTILSFLKSDIVLKSGLRFFNSQKTSTFKWVSWAIEFVNELTGWNASGAGKIFHTTTGGQNLVNILSPETNIPSEFDLLQNYPNPFNSETTIEFRINEDNFYKLEIFDLLGKKLDVPVNKNVKAGIYKLKYNAENLSSGFYIYRLSSKKEFLQKKFILLK